MDKLIRKLEMQGSISAHELPHDLMSFYGECSAKEISLDIWNKIAISLYENGETEKFANIMHYIQTIEMDKSIHDTPSGRIYKRNINNTTIQALLAKASKEENLEQRNLYFQQAISTLNTSRIKDVKWQNYSILGFINFYQNKQIGFTLKNLLNACLCEKTDIIDILGQGQVCFYAKEYQKALDYFKEAIKKNPRLPGRARLGLAYCFYMLKKYELAKRAFQRVIDLDPRVYEAYLGLAVLASQRCDQREYIKNLNKAYELNKENPLVLYYIAEFYYQQGDFQNVKKAASKALTNLKLIPKVLVEADKLKAFHKQTRTDYYDFKSNLLFMIGHCFHLEKKYEETQKFYELSLASNRGNLQAGFGLSQIFINNLQYDQACKRLEEIRTQVPENEKEIIFEIYKPLAYLLSKLASGSNKQQQQEYYQKALQFHPNDYEAQLEYANNLTESEPAESLNFFRQALNVLQKKNEHINPEIFNNIGVLELHLQNYAKAQEAFKFALNSIETKEEELKQMSQSGEKDIDIEDHDQEESKTKRVSFLCTVKFNMGILMEGLENLQEASRLYQEVLQLCPYYLDAYVRLSYIELRLGNFQGAIQYCDEGLEKKDDIKNANVRSDLVLCMKGYIQNQYDDDQSSRETFNLIKRLGINDNYSKLYLYYMDYENASEKRDNSEFPKKMMVMGQKIKDILNAEPTNVQALMVLGVVLAENGQISEAKEIFNVLKENIGVFPNIFFNLGQLQFLERSYLEALTSYKKYQEKAKNINQEYLLTQIALCYVHLDKYKEAKNTIKKLILQYPSSLTHRFNFFIIQQLEVEKVFSDPSKSLAEKEAAFASCKRTKDFMEFLKNDPKCKKSRYQDHFCTSTKQKLMDGFSVLMEQCETKKLILDANISSFEKMLQEARHKQANSSEKQSHFDDVLRKWCIDKEIKRLRQEEEKRLQDLKDQEKRNERARKLEEIQNLLEKQSKEAEEKNKQKRRDNGDGKSTKKRNKKRRNDDDEEEDDDQIDDNYIDEMNEVFDEDIFNMSVEENNNNNDKQEDTYQGFNNGSDQEVRNSKIKPFEGLEPPLRKKKKLLRKGRKNSDENNGDDFDGELDEFFGNDTVEKDNEMDQEENNQQKPQESNVEEQQSQKKPKRKAIIDDDEDPEEIFND